MSKTEQRRKTSSKTSSGVESMLLAIFSCASGVVETAEASATRDGQLPDRSRGA
jgi:hypothetical protein